MSFMIRKYLITGGLGFIGSNLSRYLSKNESNEILIVDSLTYSGNLNSLPEMSSQKNISFSRTSLSERDELSKIIANYRPDVIMHLAAESHVDKSIDSPRIFIDTNIIGTFNLLESARDYLKINNDFLFMHISTDEVFGDLDNKQSKFDENSNYDPSSPYSASKASSDHLVRAWGRTYGINFIISNCSNNYGPFQFPEKLIPHMILSALSNKDLPIYGDGSQIRDWLHVEDHCKALEIISLKGKIGRTYLIGGDNEITNKDIVLNICEILQNLLPTSSKKTDHYKQLIKFVKDRPGHDRKYAIDFKLISKELGWKPQVEFHEGLSRTVKWYLDNKGWWEEILDKKYKLERIGK